MAIGAPANAALKRTHFAVDVWVTPRFRRIVRRATALIAIVTAAALAGCTPIDHGASPRAHRTAISGAPSRSVAAISVEPLAHLPGGVPVTVEGTTWEIPQGWLTDRPSTGGVAGAPEVVRLFEPNGSQPVGALTVSKHVRADAASVAAALDGVRHAWSGVAADVVQQPVTWRGLSDATALTFSYDDPNGRLGRCDALVIAAHDRVETTLAIVLITAPKGTLDQSTTYQVMRTLRFGP